MLLNSPLQHEDEALYSADPKMLCCATLAGGTWHPRRACCVPELRPWEVSIPSRGSCCHPLQHPPHVCLLAEVAGRQLPHQLLLLLQPLLQLWQP